MGALIRIGALINKHQIGGGGQLLDRRALNRIIKANRRQRKEISILGNYLTAIEQSISFYALNQIVGSIKTSMVSSMETDFLCIKRN